MKFLSILLLLMAFIGKEVAVDILDTDDQTASLYTNEAEDTSEKEASKTLEDEEKIEPLNNKIPWFGFFQSGSTFGLYAQRLDILNPFIEIHSPPPELYS